MTAAYASGIEIEGELALSRDDFTINSMDDELRVDGLCQKLLKRFYLQLMENGMDPVSATARASSADYYLRDFLIDHKQRNLLDEITGAVRQFAGNWYIINTIEPEIGQLSGHLDGIRAFYGFLCGLGLVSARFTQSIEEECSEIEYYRRRIESFWEIKGDGYYAWERECSLKDE